MIKILVQVMLCVFGTAVGRAQCDLDFSDTQTHFFICQGEEVTFDPKIKGGVAPYRYSWSPSERLNNGSIQNPTGRISGVYFLTVTDNQGCAAQLAFVISQYPVIPLRLGPDLSICQGDTAKIFPGYTSPEISVSWSPKTGTVRSTSEYLLFPLRHPLFTLENNAMKMDALPTTLFWFL